MAELRCFSHVLPPTLLIMLLYLGVGDRAGCKALKKQAVNDSLTLEYVLPRLRRLFDGLEDVEIALLFGSLARDKTSGHDVDIALKLKREDLLETGHIIAQVAKTPHINEDRIDVTSLDDVNPAILSNILRDGIVIKADRAALRLLLKKAQHIPNAKAELRR
jgi:predicted nucleotidyltransferase